MASTNGKDNDPVIIKKYANRRLYNTATSSYVTLEHLAQMVKDGVDFVVRDAKSGEDITRSVLTQIIFEEESKGENMLPINFLRQLIALYGDNLQPMVPNYLEMAMETFTRHQDDLRTYMDNTFGDMFPFGDMEDMSRRNAQMFKQAMSFMNPLLANNPSAPANAENGQNEDRQEDLKKLRQQLARMQEQLDKLAREK